MICSTAAKTKFKVTIEGIVKYVYTRQETALKYKDRILQVWGLQTLWEVVDTNPRGDYRHCGR